MTTTTDSVLELLRSRGLRMTPQRRAIVAEIMAADGHIAPARVADRVRERMPGVNPSTVYRTLAMLEEMGVLSHAHMESGAEYHRSAEGGHVHLVCSSCGGQDELSAEEGERMKDLINTHHGFEPDLSHFAIAGRCRACQGRQQSESGARAT
jgi:Fur family ferric uptake transcriptional regulator